jgi:hypothetical protein
MRNARDALRREALKLFDKERAQLCLASGHLRPGNKSPSPIAKTGAPARLPGSTVNRTRGAAAMRDGQERE